MSAWVRAIQFSKILGFRFPSIPCRSECFCLGISAYCLGISADFCVLAMSCRSELCSRCLGCYLSIAKESLRNVKYFSSSTGEKDSFGFRFSLTSSIIRGRGDKKVGNQESLERVGNIHLLLKRDVEYAVAVGCDVKLIVTDNERFNRTVGNL